MVLQTVPVWQEVLDRIFGRMEAEKAGDDVDFEPCVILRYFSSAMALMVTE